MDQPVNRYLRDAIGAEKSFEVQLRRFAGDTRLARASELFLVHADETREQYELLTARLQTLGGSGSGSTASLVPVFEMEHADVRAGHFEEERTTQDLVVAFAIENAEVAICEVLRITAGMAGDTMTASIIERIQTQEQQAAEKIWKLIDVAASRQNVGGTSIEEFMVLPDMEADGNDFEKITQSLIIAYARASGKMALCEVLQTIAKAAGDIKTLKLVQQQQIEASEDHRLAWEKLPEAARTSSRALLSTV